MTFSESTRRFGAIVMKEFVQMRRDRLTFAMMLGIPMIQLIIFGYAINTDPKHLPTALHISDHSEFTRAYVTALQNSEYFHVSVETSDPSLTDDLLAKGGVQFVITIPVNFTRDLIRGQKPQILIEADATDPVAVGNAVRAAQEIARSVWKRNFQGALNGLNPGEDPVEVRVHSKYNPEAITHNNIVPGLMGVVLTMTMVIITSVAITRERERGTMETLLSTPAKPIEVMVGKIVPYVCVGYVQITLITLASRLVFDVPFFGSLLLLYLCAFFFLCANLLIGIFFSTLAKTQMQAMQMSFFWFLPSILLSGYMFPFRGMPQWAQVIGSCLPITHFLRIVRGIMLKGNGPLEIFPHFWPILLFCAVVLLLGSLFYRKTLD
jgi:ABC-2 type transport system permease protein